MSEKQLQNKIERLNAEIEQLNKEVKHHSASEDTLRCEVKSLSTQMLKDLDKKDQLKARINELEGEQDE